MKKRSWMELTSRALVGSYSFPTKALCKNTQPGPYRFHKQMDTTGLVEGQRQWEEIVSDNDNNLASPRASHPGQVQLAVQILSLCK